MKKTMRVEDIRKMANEYLQTSTNDPMYRKGVSSLLEQILHETGNYKGFGYLCQKDVPEGQLPGIRHSDADDHDTRYKEHFENTDPSRVFYY